MEGIFVEGAWVVYSYMGSGGTRRKQQLRVESNWAYQLTSRVKKSEDGSRNNFRNVVHLVKKKKKKKKPMSAILNLKTFFIFLKKKNKNFIKKII